MILRVFAVYYTVDIESVYGAARFLLRFFIIIISRQFCESSELLPISMIKSAPLFHSVNKFNFPNWFIAGTSIKLNIYTVGIRILSKLVTDSVSRFIPGRGKYSYVVSTYVRSTSPPYTGGIKAAELIILSLTKSQINP